MVLVVLVEIRLKFNCPVLQNYSRMNVGFLERT